MGVIARLAAILGITLAAAVVIGVWKPSLVGLGSGPRYRTTSGARVVRFTLRSRLLHRSLHEVAVEPARSGRRPLLVLLHGRSMAPDGLLSQQFFHELRRLGRRAPIVLFPDGGDHSYWHDRRDGLWGSYVLREAIPAAIHRFSAERRVAIGGVSMGGFGAIDLARLSGRFCAVGAHSAALWDTPAQTAPGAFDDAADYLRHDWQAALPVLSHVPVWVDVGEQDPFRAADTDLGTRLQGHAIFKVWPGRHDALYWNAHMPQYLAFYARALERCRR